MGANHGNVRGAEIAAANLQKSALLTANHACAILAGCGSFPQPRIFVASAKQISGDILKHADSACCDHEGAAKLWRQQAMRANAARQVGVQEQRLLQLP